MKKIILFFLVLSSILINPFALKAQCHDTVHYDASAGANGSSTFNITTANPNELIMIAYDGWPSPGTGPVKVDGNSATHIATGFDNNNSGIAETYGYIAPAAGTHTIVCTEPSYSSPYYLNFAAAFYQTGNLPLSIPSPASLCLHTDSNITCITGGKVTGVISVSVPGTMIYCNWEN
ncbi:MAG TPA: hypothetical protein VGF75_04325, partial [Candidatus Saccharimonadales bacterium]